MTDINSKQKVKTFKRKRRIQIEGGRVPRLINIFGNRNKRQEKYV